MAALSIRPSQMPLLEQGAVDNFLARLHAHLVAELPDEWRAVAAPAGLARCLEIFRRAQRLGFETISEIARFAEVVTLTDPGFGLASEHAIALRMLEDVDIVKSWPRERGLVVALASLPPEPA